MGVTVCKFGGSSVADAAQLLKVREIVRSEPARRYVVPSAPGKRSPSDTKVTDLLYLCHKHAESGVEFGDIFTMISDRYMSMVKELGLELDLSEPLAQVREDINAGAGADYAASRGEFLSGHIVAALLGYDLVDPADLICFDARGRFDSEATQQRVAEGLATHEHAVIPGFYGARPDGQVQTFSRGGSDITGAIVARGVSANVYENWTDVSGLLMTDPRIVDNPRSIAQLTYRELRELAYMGATVLHDEAIFPVREVGIPVNIRNTNVPTAPGTLIIRETGDLPADGQITGIAGRKGFTTIAVEKTLMNSELGFGRRLLSVLERNGVSFEHMPSGIDTLSVVVRAEAVDGILERVVEEIRLECRPDSLDVYPGIALIATVGRGMARSQGMAANLFNALADAGVNIRMIDQGSSELNIIVGVDESDFETAIKAIYNRCGS